MTIIKLDYFRSFSVHIFSNTYAKTHLDKYDFRIAAIETIYPVPKVFATFSRMIKPRSTRKRLLSVCLFIFQIVSFYIIDIIWMIQLAIYRTPYYKPFCKNDLETSHEQRSHIFKYSFFKTAVCIKTARYETTLAYWHTTKF